MTIRNSLTSMSRRLKIRSVRCGVRKNDTFKLPFKHSAGFGKRIEYWVIGQMLKEGLEVTIYLYKLQAEA